MGATNPQPMLDLNPERGPDPWVAGPLDHGLGVVTGYTLDGPLGRPACGQDLEWFFTSTLDCSVSHEAAGTLAFAGHSRDVGVYGGGYSIQLGPGVEVVPLPAAAWMMLAGLGMLSLFRRAARQATSVRVAS